MLEVYTGKKTGEMEIVTQYLKSCRGLDKKIIKSHQQKTACDQTSIIKTNRCVAFGL